MAITQKFVKENNKQCFAVYTISKETINKYFEEHEADAGQKQEALTKFEGLRDFLRDMLEKYGQTYVEDINGRGGLTVEDDKIELVLWRFCDFELEENGNYDLPYGCLITHDGCFYFEEDDIFFEVYDAICLAISAYGVDFNTLIEPDDYHLFETETLSYMYEENESSEYTHKLFSFFISDDQDLEECIDDYDSRAEGILVECCEISWHYEDFGRIVNKTVKSDSGAKFSVLIKDGVIGDDVTYISDSALYTMKKDYTSGNDVLSVYGVKLKFADLWNNENSKYYTVKLNDICEDNRFDYSEQYADYIRDDFEFDGDEDEEEQERLIEEEVNRQADAKLVGNIIEQIVHLVNMEFDELKIAEYTEDCDSCLPERFVLDVLEKMKKIHSDTSKIDRFISTKRSKEQIIGSGTKVIESEEYIRRNYDSIIISDSVEVIGESAFKYCDRLVTIVIPDSVIEIQGDCFGECINLKSVSLPKGLKAISDELFWKCRSLESVEIPNGVESIGEFAFYGCENLKSISIPDSVKSIGHDAFRNCHSLSEITLPKHLTKLDEFAFCNCKSLKSITIPSGVTELNSRMFNGCESLESVRIMNCEAKFMTKYTEFEECKSLKEVVFDGESANYTVHDGVVYNKDMTETVAVLGSYTEISVVNGVKTIGKDTFGKNTTLKTLHIPMSVTSIGFPNIFSQCSALTQIIVDKNNKEFSSDGYVMYKIGKSKRLVFCSPEITELSIPDGITGIGGFAIKHDSMLKKLYIPASVNTIAVMIYDIEEVILDANNKSFTIENGYLIDKKKNQKLYKLSSKSRISTKNPLGSTSTTRKEDENVKKQIKDAIKSNPAKQPEKASPKPSSPADVKPAEPTPIKTEAPAPQAAAAEYKPPVFPPRMNESEIENLYEYTDPFDDVTGKEFAVFADEVYYDPCIEYLKQHGAKVVLEPTEKTDYIIIEGLKQANDFEYAYKAGFKGKFTFMEEIRPHLTEEQRELYHYYEDVVGFEFDYEPKYDLETSCELMYAVYDVVLGELTKCRTRPYGESIRYVTSITSYVGLGNPEYFRYSYKDMIDWIKGKETEDDFDTYEKLIYGMSFEDKLCTVLQALARYEWTGYEDDESMCDFAYKLTQKWFRKEEKPRLKEKIAKNVEYLRLRFRDIDRSDNFKGSGRKCYVPYVDLMRFEWAKDRLCVVARTDKKQKVLKSDVFSAQQGDVNLYVCYAANPEKDEYYYLDNTQPFQWRMSAVEIWNAAKEKIIWLSKKEMPANIAELIDTSISELEELGKNGRKKMLDKINKQAAQLEKYTHKIDPESVPCFANLGAVIKELEENKAKIQQQADAVEAELRAVDGKLREAFDQQNAQVPSAVKKKDTEAEIARLTDEKTHLGFFKGKQKKALQAQIDELNAQLPQLDSAIAAEKQSQKAKYDPIITELGTQKSQLQQRLKELKDLIAEADSTIESLKF